MRPKVLHFVTGGFSGATQVAVDLVQAHRHSGHFDAKLVLRHKRQTPPERVERLRQTGVDVTVVAGWSHAATIAELNRVCQDYRPDILVVHGFSEHIWGRYAGLLAKVPHMVHVEHNSRERYTWWRLRQSLWLTERTDAIVGCSQGVRASLLARGFPASKLVAIPNGISLQPYQQAPVLPFRQRQPGVVMPARFARQKDHATLLQAIALLREAGHDVPVYLAGGGKSAYLKKNQQLARRLGIDDLVHFLGQRNDVPQLLMQHQMCVLATHYEGMGLSLIEGMAAGCAVVGSRVVGVAEVVDHGRNGMLAEHADAASLAKAMRYLLEHPEAAERMAVQARADAMRKNNRSLMLDRYEKLFLRVLESAHGQEQDPLQESLETFAEKLLQLEEPFSLPEQHSGQAAAVDAADTINAMPNTNTAFSGNAPRL